VIAVTASGITDALCAGVRSRALLAMVADTLLTQAYEVEGVLTGPLVVVGSRPPSRSPPSETRDANPSSSASRSNACLVS
jgi:hypothetical protein